MDTVYSNFGTLPKAKKEKFPKGKTKVERAGYMPAKIRIEQMIQAGRRLVESRKEMFDDFSQGEPAIDPTRKPGLDLGEASMIMNQLKAKKKAVSAVTQPSPGSDDGKAGGTPPAVEKKPG